MTLNKDKTLKTLSRDQIQPVIIILTLIVAILIFTAINSSFLSFSNLHSVLLTAVPVGLIAIGECAAIMSGYFDMSSGMVAAMGGLAAASVMHANGSVPLAVLAGLAVGLLCGLLAGLCVSYLGLNAFITTYAMQEIYRGIIYIFTDGFPISLFGADYTPFTKWGQMKVLNFLQLPILVLIILYVLVSLFLRYRKLGRCIYLVGSNANCAKICGINLHLVQVFVFLLCDVLAAFAGMIYASRIGSAPAFLGETIVMEAIAATIVGGTSLAGGKGNLGLTFVGVCIIYVVKNGLIMCGLPDFYQYIAIGAILFVAVMLQVDRKKH